MNIVELFWVLLLIVLAGLGLAATTTLAVGLFPRFVARARRNLEQMPRRAFAVGLVNGLFFGLLAAGLASGGSPGGLLGLIVLTLLLLFVALGLSAVAVLLGERLGLPGAPAQQAAIATLVLFAAALTPVVGWFGVSLLAGLTGYGAVIIALFQRRRLP